jgi:hypothetical protein
MQLWVYFCVCLSFSCGNFEWYYLFIDSLIRACSDTFPSSQYYYTFAPYPEPHYLYMYSCCQSTVSRLGFFHCDYIWILLLNSPDRY